MLFFLLVSALLFFLMPSSKRFLPFCYCSMPLESRYTNHSRRMFTFHAKLCLFRCFMSCTIKFIKFIISRRDRADQISSNVVLFHSSGFILFSPNFVVQFFGPSKEKLSCGPGCWLRWAACHQLQKHGRLLALFVTLNLHVLSET